MRGNITNYLDRRASEKAKEAALKKEAEELSRARQFNAGKSANTPWEDPKASQWGNLLDELKKPIGEK